MPVPVVSTINLTQPVCLLWDYPNPPVQLAVRRLRQTRPAQRMGKEQQHWKLWVADAAANGAAPVEVVWWAAGAATAPSTPVFDLAVVPEINAYNGQRRLQLKMLDWRPAEI